MKCTQAFIRLIMAGMLMYMWLPFCPSKANATGGNAKTA